MSIPNLKSTWGLLFPEVPTPSERQFVLWTLLHEPDIVRDAFAQLAAKYAKLDGNMDQNFMIRYSSSIMNRLTREAKAHSQTRTGAESSR